MLPFVLMELAQFPASYLVLLTRTGPVIQLRILSVTGGDKGRVQANKRLPLLARLPYSDAMNETGHL